MSARPTEEQIHAFAEKIGAIGPDGAYNERRNTLAAGAQKWLEELAKERETSPDRTPTVDELARLHVELRASFVDPELARDLLVSMAPALVRRQGLQLKSKGNPRND